MRLKGFAVVLVVLGSGLAGTWAWAGAGSAFDPSDFVKHREYENAEKEWDMAVTQAIVLVDGVVYRKFSTKLGSIILPKTDELRPDDLDRALCATGVELPASAMMVKTPAELRLADKVRLYARQIAKVVRAKCMDEH